MDVPDLAKAVFDVPPTLQAPQSFQFLKGNGSNNPPISWPNGADEVRKNLSDSLNAKHVAFLVGAGCSSHKENGIEVGISTMLPLAAEFTDRQKIGQPGFPTEDECRLLRLHFGLDLSSPEYARNLERLMELLHSLNFCVRRSNRKRSLRAGLVIESLISKVQGFIWEKCTRGEFARGNTSVPLIYETFYRKLVLRDRSLPRPWVFTTNYDLFNETALDRLGLPYTNGFSGIVERRFNPATFRYALAEQLDLSHRKWTTVDGFVYLCKLHGSISWTEDNHGLFPIREQVGADSPEKVMIYPTPAKQNSSLGSPYSDLFREFQGRIVRDQSILFTLGYAFGDEHINNIIYQGLTIPTFRLVIFADPALGGEIAKLKALNDPRIWIIGGDGPQKGTKAHYFDTIVEHFMPQGPSDRIDEAIRKALVEMSSTREDNNQ